MGQMCSEASRAMCWRLLLGLISNEDKTRWPAQMKLQIVDYIEQKALLMPALDKVEQDPLSALLSEEENEKTESSEKW